MRAIDKFDGQLYYPSQEAGKEGGKNMMTSQSLRVSIVAASLILFATVTMLVMETLSVEAVNAQGKCTLTTIKGTYIFQARGVVIDEGAVRPYAEAGTWTLDGKGKAAGVISASIDGVAFATGDAFTATYALKADCVYTAVDAFGLAFELYTTPTGRTITYFSPGFSGTMFKQ
jgi:hypothetical protein